MNKNNMDTLIDDSLREKYYNMKMIYLVCFDVISLLILYIFLNSYSSSAYYFYLPLPFFLINTYSALYIIFPSFLSRHKEIIEHEWTYEDFDPPGICPLNRNLFLSRPVSKPYVAKSMGVKTFSVVRTNFQPHEPGPDEIRPHISEILRWRSWKLVLFWGNLFWWLRPYALFASMNGIDTPTGWSSCTTDYESPGNVFNPHGYFNKNEYYIPSNPYVFCTLPEAKWAYPTYNSFIYGYKESPGDIGESIDGTAEYCKSEKVAASTRNGYVSVFCKEAYLDKSIGVRTTIFPSDEKLTPELISLCPANTGSIVKLNSKNEISLTKLTEDGWDRKIGRPHVLCSSCLNYWREMTGVHTGPTTEFSICPHFNDKKGAASLGCFFCPGLGYGWLHSEKHSKYYIDAVFYIATTYVFILPVVEFIIFYSIMGYTNKKCRKIQLSSYTQ